VPAELPAEAYATPPAAIRVLAVESSDVISGHSDVSNPATHWMLLSQTSRAG
jgi:hypothetical protein